MFQANAVVRVLIRAALAGTAFALGSPLRGADEALAEKPFRRMDISAEDALRTQLSLVPELGFSQAEAGTLYNGGAKRLGGNQAASRLDVGPLYYDKMRVFTGPGEFHSLPWRVRADCQISADKAETLNKLSTQMRRTLSELSTSRDGKKILVDPTRLRSALVEMLGKEPAPEAIPTLMQLLQAEPGPIRMVLVEMLGRIPGRDASVALARRAVFDLAPDVREKAVRILETRPAADFADALVTSLRYPWPPAAYHAAEAIAFLELKQSADSIDAISREPDPRLPSVGRGTMEKSDGLVTRELVRVNHMANCLLCHAPSRTPTDLVRGLAPTPGEEPPKEPELYYGSLRSVPPPPGAIFARADITYLRQEFSVMQPVSQAERFKWPADQRYDYMVRQRKVTSMRTPNVQAVQRAPGQVKNAAVIPVGFDAAGLPDPNFNQKAAAFALAAVRPAAQPAAAGGDPRPAHLPMPIAAVKK